MEDITKFSLNFYKEGGIQIGQKTRSGHSAFHLACVEGFLNLVKIFIEHGVNVNEPTNEEDTALHLCVKKHLLLRNLPQQLQGWELYPDIETVSAHGTK